jgi:hypothetical protein
MSLDESHVRRRPEHGGYRLELPATCRDPLLRRAIRWLRLTPEERRVAAVTSILVFSLGIHAWVIAFLLIRIAFLLVRP